MQSASRRLRGKDEVEPGPETEFADGERVRGIAGALGELGGREEYTSGFPGAVGVVVDIVERARHRALAVEVYGGGGEGHSGCSRVGCCGMARRVRGASRFVARKNGLILTAT